MIDKLDLFSGLSPETVSKIEAISETLDIPRGKLLFSEGERAEYIWGVIEGKVKLSKISPNGREQTILIVEEGKTFAEIAALRNQNYPVYATAIKESRLVRIKGSLLAQLIKEDPSVAMALLALFIERVKYLTDLIEEISLKEVPARLAGYILKESQGKEFVMLKVSKTELAKLLATTPETLSRSFKKLSSIKAIEVRGSLIRITSRQKLEDIHESLP